jgi:hypothetical protein
MPLIPENLRLYCGIVQQDNVDGTDLTLYGYDVGAVHQGAWQSLVISPVIYGAFKEAEAAGNTAMAAAKKAILKRRLKNIAKMAALSRRENDDAS